ncbi:hypothetical protein [Erwinia sp. S38]|uniref:hypothetical protein n=1 Tax=Erwinia sp. S38 TaxID=2769338 RepID=UPI00190BAF77|nr:hypothetical protein [Erwinia sp. S38]MBK0004806.1 hypothetical protein [Erwinia sp. S38]
MADSIKLSGKLSVMDIFNTDTKEHFFVYLVEQDNQLAVADTSVIALLQIQSEQKRCGCALEKGAGEGDIFLTALVYACGAG